MINLNKKDKKKCKEYDFLLKSIWSTYLASVLLGHITNKDYYPVSVRMRRSHSFELLRYLYQKQKYFGW